MLYQYSTMDSISSVGVYKDIAGDLLELLVQSSDEAHVEEIRKNFSALERLAKEDAFLRHKLRGIQGCMQWFETGVRSYDSFVLGW